MKRQNIVPITLFPPFGGLAQGVRSGNDSVFGLPALQKPGKANVVHKLTARGGTDRICHRFPGDRIARRQVQDESYSSWLQRGPIL